MLDSKVEESAEYLRRRGIVPGAKALALEQEMKGFAGELSGLTAVPAKEVPFFPPPLTPLRNRKILCGELGGEQVVVLEGRAALFEGYFHREVAFPLRVLSALGVRRLIVATYVIALDDSLSAGDLVTVQDHVDLSIGSTLRGFQPSPEFLPLPGGGIYSPELSDKAAAVAAREGKRMEKVVTALINGPSGPTPAECRMLLGMGARVASLTLAAEAATAFQVGMELAAVGVVRDGTRAGSHAPWGPEMVHFFKDLLLVA